METKKTEVNYETEIMNLLEQDLSTLERLADKYGAYEGVLDDDYEDAFNRWCESQTTMELLEKYVAHLRD